MKRIEFYGPICSGKSTLHANLFNGNKKEYAIDAKDEVYNILLNQIKQNSILKYSLLKLILFTPIKNRVFSNYDFYHYLKDDEEATKLINYVLKDLNISYNSDSVKVLVRLNYLLKDLSDLIVLKKYSKKKLVIHDESLIQRGLSFSLDNSLNKLENYFENIIYPDGIIYVKTSKDILKNRVLSRSKNSSGFYGKKAHSNKEIENSANLSESIYSLLKKKDLNILTINGNENLNTNIDLIGKWVKTI